MKLKLMMLGGAFAALTACGGSAGVGGGSLSGDDVAFLQDAASGPAGQVETINDRSFGSLINGFRASENAGTVTYDARLDAAAQGHANDMVSKGYFSHTGADGRSVQQRIQAQGYNALNFGENIARGQKNEATALAGWINSPPHLALLEADSVDEFGLGMAGSGNSRTWVLVMAKER